MLPVALVLALLATFAVAVERAAADHQPDDENGPYTDQTVDGDPLKRIPDDPECTDTAFPGQRTLIGTEQTQTFIPSRSDLSAVSLCLTSNVLGAPFTVTITHDEGTEVVQGQSSEVAKSYFHRVDLGSTVAVTAGKEYTLRVTGPEEVDVPSAVLAWRLTCAPSVQTDLRERCDSSAPDRYRDGTASGGAFGSNADFGFRTLTPDTADLTAALTSGPRHVCRDRSFPAQLTVSNVGQADVRSSELTVQLSEDDSVDANDAQLVRVDVARDHLGHAPHVLRLDVDLTIPPDALQDFDGRARLLVTVDAEDVVVESDETNNVAQEETVLTSCDAAGIAALDLTATPDQITAGVGEVPISDLPVASIPFGGTGLASTPLNANPLNANPLNANPLNANPLLDAPLNANPLNANPLNANPLNANSFLFGAHVSVLEQILLTDVALLRPGGWQAVLDAHAEAVASPDVDGSPPINHVALQHLTLADVMRLDPVPEPVITWAELDLSASGLGGLVLAATATGATPLADIPLPSGQPWCAFLAEHGIDCAAQGFDEATGTLVTINLLGMDMNAVPFAGITMDTVRLHAASPLAAVTLQHGDPTREFDPRLTPWSNASVTGDLVDLVDCGIVSCDGSTDLAEVADADAFLSGTTVRDLLAALPIVELERATLSDAILGTIHNAASLPLERAQLDPLQLSDLIQDGPFVSYTLAVTADPGGSSLVDPDLQVTLPRDFAYVPGSARLVASDTGAVLGDPATAPVDGRVSLTWSPDLYVPAGSSVELRFDANPGRYLGTFTSTGSVAGTDLSTVGTYTATSDETAAVTVVERYEPNGPDDPESSWVTLPPDTLTFSHIGAAGDLDVWRIPVPQDPHSRIKIVLSHLPEDYDLLLGGATANPLNANPLNANPLNANPLHANPLNANRVVPEDGVQWEANATVGTTPPETLQDLPLNANPLNANGVRAVSVERGTTHETIIIETVDGEGGYFPLVVSGYNGAHSSEPYVLRYHEVAPHRIDLGACQPKPFADDGHPGTLPDPAAVDATTNTLFLVAPERVGGRFGSAQRDALLSGAADLSARDDLGVRGLTVPVAGVRWDGAPNPVADAYGAWDASRCDPVAANTVAGTIRDLVLEYRRHLPITHVVVLGDDDQIPFLRLRDGSVLANEINFVSTAVADMGDPDLDDDPSNGLQPANATPLTAALQAGLFLTDDHLGTAQARPWLDHAAWIPDIGVGRVTGDVDTMLGVFDRFVGSDGRLDPEILQPTDTAVAGYDHLADGATLVADRLDARLSPSAGRLIDETWTRDELGQLLTFDADDRDVVVSVNGHADHRRLLPALGNRTGSTDDLYDTGDLATLPPGALVFSMACHFGYDLPADPSGSARDWADTTLGRQGILLANSGFNYGDTATVAAGELYAALFADRLDGQLTVGQVNALTKAEMYAREGTYGAEFLKSMQGMVLFGLPFYRIAGTADDDPSVTLPQVQEDPVTGLEIADLTIDLPLVPTATDCPEGSSCLVPATTPDGTYHRVVGPLGYEPLAVSGRPIGPRAVLDVTGLISGDRRVHGAVVLSAESTDVADLDPVFARSIVDLAGRESEPQAMGTIFPTAPLNLTTVDTPLGERQLLTVLPWTFRTDGSSGGGDLRLDTSLSVRLYLSSSGDNVPPEIREVRARRQDDDVTFRVTTAAISSSVATVIATYRDHLGTWHDARLSSNDGSTWFGVGPLAGTEEAPIDVLVQAIDADGDSGYWRHKGDRLPLAAAGQLAFTLDGTPGDSGWFRSPVTVSLPVLSQDAYERRLDGGPWEPFTGNSFTIDGDGTHHVDVRAPDGSATHDIVITIDAAAPAVEIRAPEDGGVYRTDDTLQVDFGCQDATSGVVACDGTYPDGASVSLEFGEDQTFTVTARDRAGNTTTVTSTYDVYEPPIEFRGFFSPVVNGVFNVVSDTTDTVPFKWRLYRGGVLLDDVSLVIGLEWHEVACTEAVDDAMATGTVTPATSSNGQGVMLVADRMQYEAEVASALRGTCQRFDLRLADGQTASAWFRFERG